jgi:hypothetical protein
MKPNTFVFSRGDENGMTNLEDGTSAVKAFSPSEENTHAIRETAKYLGVTGSDVGAQVVVAVCVHGFAVVANPTSENPPTPGTIIYINPEGKIVPVNAPNATKAGLCVPSAFSNKFISLIVAH